MITIILATIAATTGVIAALGWIIGSPLLKSMVPGLNTMKPNTALCVILASIAIVILQTRIKGYRAAAAVSGFLVAAIGLLTFAQFLTGLSFGIDELLAADPATVAPYHPGRMSPAAAIGFAAIGLSLILFAIAQSRRALVAAHALVPVPAAIGFLSLAGYAYNIEALYSFGPFVTVAFNTAFALACLSVALLMTHADDGWLSGYRGRPVARKLLLRFLVLSVTVPVVVGYFVIRGTRSGYYEASFGPALFALGSTIAFVWLALGTSRALAKAEGLIIDSVAKAQDRANELRAVFDAAPVGLAVFDRDLRYVRVNERFAAINDIPVVDHIGKKPTDILPDCSERAVATMHRVLAGEPMLGVEFVGTTKAQPGVVRTWRENWMPFKNKAGEIIGITVSADEVTHQKTAEARNALLLTVIETLQNSPRNALTGVATVIGTHMAVSRTGFGEVADNNVMLVVQDEYIDGTVPSAIGEHILDDFGKEIIDELRAGPTLVIEDVITDPRTAASSAAHIAIGTRSAVTVPLIRNGRLRGTFYINHREPRRFSSDEILLVEEVASRAWSVMEQARSEALLHETTRMLDAVLDNASVAVFLMDDRQYCSYMNTAAERLTGYTFAETQGRPLHDVVHHTYPDGRPFPLSECAIDTAFPENANTRGEEVFVHKDGSFYPVAFVASPIRDERSQTVGTIIEVRDIAEEKAAVAALASSEAQFRTTAEALPGLLFMTSIEGHNYFVNETYRSYTGRTTEELLGTRWAETIHPEDREQALALWFEGSKTGKPYVSEYRFRRYDGEWRFHAVRALPVRDDRGTITNWVGTCIDIHERKLTEDELQREIAVAVSDREVALAQLHEAQKLETLGQLTGGVAHDFNNLLTPVIMGLEMLRQAHGDARSQKLTSGALQSAERAKTLVQRLLAFARRQTLDPRPVDAALLIENMRDLIDRSLGPVIKIVVEVAEDLPAAMVDPNQLELALLNLSINSRDAMPDGGVLTIVVEAEEFVEGEAQGLAPGRYVRFSVTDTGTGMDADTLQRAIEPFFSTKDVGQGTGLGLSMVHGLAGQSGGTFRLSFEPGIGTMAALWIPATYRKPDDVTAIAPHAPAATRKATLLLVDDEELVRFSTAEGLRMLGYDVIEVASGAQALERVRDGLTPDLLITDHMMPGMTGARLASELREIAPALPVLVVTGYANLEPLQTKGLNILSKPFGQADLAARVAALFHDDGKVVSMSSRTRSKSAS